MHGWEAVKQKKKIGFLCELSSILQTNWACVNGQVFCLVLGIKGLWIIIK